MTLIERITTDFDGGYQRKSVLSVSSAFYKKPFRVNITLLAPNELNYIPNRIFNSQ